MNLYQHLVHSSARNLRCDFPLALCVLSVLFSHAMASWGQFQGNAGHTGFVPNSGIPQLVTPTWSFKTIPFLDPTPAVQLSPGIASDGQNVFVSWIGSPSTVNGVNALNISTGAQVWEWTFQGNDDEDISAPSYGDGRLYVHRWGHSSSCGTTCNDKPRLLGINAINGQQLFDQTHSGQWSSGGRPTPEGGQVFVAGGYYGGLDRYNAVSGSIEWFASMPQTYGWIPAVYGEKVYTSFGGNLTVVDRNSGAQQLLLAPSGSGSSSSTPTVVSPHEAYVPEGRLITQFDPTNRYATWEFKVQSGGIRNDGIAIGNSALYVNFGATVKAIDRQSGAFLWEWTAPATLSSNVVLSTSHLFVASESETFAINLTTRVKDWSAPYGGSIAVDGNTLFVSNTSALHAFALVPEPFTMMLIVPFVLIAPLRRTRMWM